MYYKLRNPQLEPISSRIPLDPHENTCYYSVMGLQFVMEKELFALSPYDNFVYALKAESSKRQYPRKLERFLSFIGFEGTIEEKWINQKNGFQEMLINLYFPCSL
ncbi:hypothetical protein BH18THE1_BH18THE1_22310 [soil metagenome]